MINLIEALNYRCLRYVQTPLSRFHVLVGANASGKTTFLDVVSFLGTLVSAGLDEAVGETTANFQDLVWGRAGDRFELAIEASIPERLRAKLAGDAFRAVRYELAIGAESDGAKVAILAEKVLLKGQGPYKSALANLPADETKFPVATWLKGLLAEGVQKLVLNSQLMRKASPPGQGKGFRPDGSNLPWVIARLKQEAPDRFDQWIAHLRTALPDIRDVRTVERPDDKHRYLVICYGGGLEVPSWVASDGTLRLLALTLPAYITDFHGTYLVEEPENGIHPKAVETVFQSLSSVYDAQVLLATHSNVVLSVADAADVLCFAKTQEGGTDIVSGSEHPKLREWRGDPNLGVVFAAGVLG